jgi:protein gp37
MGGVSSTSAIEWTEATWNPVVGCSHVSAGCDHCYAEELHRTRLDSKGVYPEFKPWFAENAEHNVTLVPARLDQPERWRTPRMVFVNSMSDMFHPRVPSAFIGQVFGVMERCPQHTFQILTKRPKRMRDWCRQHRPEPLPNVWLGTSIESNEWVSRADLLRQTPVAVRFVSAEPLLGPLSTLNLCWIDWLIVGGESGPHHRPIRAEWVHELLSEARYYDTAFFFKQWGGRTPKAGGRELDGKTYDEMPTPEVASLF